MEHATLAAILIVALAFANGTNDVSKAIATLVGSGISSYRLAIVWGTAWTIGGALASAWLAGAMITTFTTGLVEPALSLLPVFGISIAAGAMAWVLIASRTGLPVSTTHALTGGIVGSGLLAFGSAGLIWPAIFSKLVIPLLLSPFLALLVSLVLQRGVRTVLGAWEGTCVCVMPTQRALVFIGTQGTTRVLFQANAFGVPVADIPARCERAGLRGLSIGPDTIHWLSSGLASFARGMNDAPKIVAMLLLGGTVVAWGGHTWQVAATGGVALAMGLGSYLGGRRVTEVLAEKITRMDHLDGLSANLTTSSLVLTAATLGLPVSTTHVSSSAIIGIGLLKGLRAVRWGTVRDMVLAWLVTLPAAAVLAALAYWLLTLLS